MELIKSKDNQLIKNISKLVSDKKERTQSGLFVIEGVRICLDAFYSEIHINTVLITESCYKKHEDKVTDVIKKADSAYLIDDSVAKKISDTETPQGMFCVCAALDKDTDIDKINNDGYFLALENISDPGNMGTIIRTADAFGIDALIISSDCVDVLSPKVLRSTMGSAFRLPIIKTEFINEFIIKMNEKGYETFAAVLDSDSKKLSATSLKKGTVVVIGNEGSGITEKTISVCKNKLYIDMNGKSESLNAAVAASVIMWEMSKNISK